MPQRQHLSELGLGSETPTNGECGGEISYCRGGSTQMATPPQDSFSLSLTVTVTIFHLGTGIGGACPLLPGPQKITTCFLLWEGRAEIWWTARKQPRGLPLQDPQTEGRDRNLGPLHSFEREAYK